MRQFHQFFLNRKYYIGKYTSPMDPMGYRFAQSLAERLDARAVAFSADGRTKKTYLPKV